MFKIFQYYTQYQGVRGSLGSMPPWARAIVAIFALPGLVLAALSIVALCVSLLALLLLSVPVYQLLKRLTGGGAGNLDGGMSGHGMSGQGISVDVNTMVLEALQAAPTQPRRQVEVKIVEETHNS